MLYDLTAVQWSKMLSNLSAILDKAVSAAEERKIDFGVLLNSRLAPGQFHFTRQIQIACNTANLGVARLTGKLESTREPAMVCHLMYRPHPFHNLLK